MEKEINIDDILEKYYSDGKGNNIITKARSKKAIKRILTEFAKMCADEAKTIGVNASNGVTYWSKVDKESITQLINKIKF